MRGTLKESWLWKINYGVFLALILCLIFFESYWFETIGYLGNIIIDRYYIWVAGIIAVWTVNGIIAKKSVGHVENLIKIWWLQNSNHRDKWNSLDYQILKNRGYV